MTSGPGGVCCTNYSIVDVSSDLPRAIFNSEDFGHFRNPMEIFDADSDGVYELVQFDSCMRYFRDDCGSCSPEPRAYFAYDRKLKRYRPTKGIQEVFVERAVTESEKWIDSKYDEFKKTNDIQIAFELRRTLIAYIADLLHVGEERKAWSLFKEFSDIVDDEDKAEMRKRLAHCNFYKALQAKDR